MNPFCLNVFQILSMPLIVKVFIFGHISLILVLFWTDYISIVYRNCMFEYKPNFGFEGARHYPHHKQSFQALGSTNPGRNSFLLGRYEIKPVLMVVMSNPTSTPFGNEETTL